MPYFTFRAEETSSFSPQPLELKGDEIQNRSWDLEAQGNVLAEPVDLLDLDEKAKGHGAVHLKHASLPRPRCLRAAYAYAPHKTVEHPNRGELAGRGGGGEYGSTVGGDWEGRGQDSTGKTTWLPRLG